MAINIGSQAVNAIVELRGNRDFEHMLDGLDAVVQTFIQRSLDAPPDTRVDQTAHARGIFDVWEALYGAYHNLKPAQVRPQSLRRQKERVDNDV